METGNNKFINRGCRCHPDKISRRDIPVYKSGCSKFDATDTLKDISLPEGVKPFDCVEIRFKNSRKDFYRNVNAIKLNIGDIVAVEASPGHDIGIVTMTGELVQIQMKKKKIAPDSPEIKKIYRKTKLSDIEKWISAIELENFTLIRSKKIVAELALDMKINDVEYQGDKTKAIFYYTADERVDFRELIKVLAGEFLVRIEMKQIGARQESSRLGGIGSCGRELCCTTWLSDFRSVSTNTARQQQLSLNPQKLTGQCSKLKCCLNYEYECYLDALKDFPNPNIILKTKHGDASHSKTDVFKKKMSYSYINDHANSFVIPVDKVKKIIEMNQKNIIPENLEEFAEVKEKKTGYESITDLEDLTKFDNLE